MKWLLLLTVAGNPALDVAGIHTITAHFETEALCRQAAAVHAKKLTETPLAKASEPKKYPYDARLAPNFVGGDNPSYDAPRPPPPVPYDVAWSCSPTSP